MSTGDIVITKVYFPEGQNLSSQVEIFSNMYQNPPRSHRQVNVQQVLLFKEIWIGFVCGVTAWDTYLQKYFPNYSKKCHQRNCL